MSMALQHVDDPSAMIAKLVGRLKPGGTVVIIDWLPSWRASSHVHGDDSHEQHPGADTVSFDGLTKEQMESLFAEAGCSSSDFVLTACPSEVPPDPSGQKQMFFAEGTK